MNILFYNCDIYKGYFKKKLFEKKELTFFSNWDRYWRDFINCKKEGNGIYIIIILLKDKSDIIWKIK